MSLRRTHVLIACAGATLIVALGAVLAHPAAERLVAREITARAAARGVDVRVGDVELGIGAVSVRDLCVHAPAPRSDLRLACLDRVDVIGWPAPAGPRVERVAVRGGRLDASAALGSLDEVIALWRSIAPISAAQTTARAQSPEIGDAFELTVDALSVQLAGQDLPADAIILDHGLFQVGPGIAGGAHVLLEASDDPDADLALPSSGALRVEGAELETARLVLEFDAPVRWVGPAGVGARARTIGFQLPSTVTLADVAVDTAAGAAATIEAAELELAALSLGAPQIRRLRVEGGSVTLPAARPAGDGGAREGSAGGDTAVWTRLETAGAFWEMLPERVELARCALLRRSPAGDATLALSIDLTYGSPATEGRATLDARLGLDTGGARAGNGTLGARYETSSGRVSVSVDLDGLDLGLLSQVILPGGVRVEGTASGSAELSATGPEGMESFSGSFQMAGVRAVAPLFAGPITVGDASYAWAAGPGPERSIVFTRGDATLNGARFGVRPTLHGAGALPWSAPRRIDLELDVPDQPAGALLGSLPPELIGVASDARMTGTWGFSAEFPITLGPSVVAGRPRLEIGEASHFEVRDEDLVLDGLPEPIDVRRLNGAFTFVFAGPSERIMRPIVVPPPRGSELGGAGGPPTSRPWARLHEISYYFIAATLYREDGRFFRNTGINYLQWRSVLGEAWAEGALGRGASTISMQLVKNVFLSHERTVERKLQELFLVYWMTRLVPKERILEVYLNVIELGPGVNGVAEAAAHYFGKGPGELTLAEAVWLSSIVPAPQRRSRQRDLGQPPEWSARTVREIIDGMADRQWISEGERLEGQAQPIRFVTWSGTPPAEPEAAAGGALDVSDLAKPAGGGEGAPALGASAAARIDALMAGARPTRTGR